MPAKIDCLQFLFFQSRSVVISNKCLFIQVFKTNSELTEMTRTNNVNISNLKFQTNPSQHKTRYLSSLWYHDPLKYKSHLTPRWHWDMTRQDGRIKRRTIDLSFLSIFKIVNKVELRNSGIYRLAFYTLGTNWNFYKGWLKILLKIFSHFLSIYAPLILSILYAEFLIHLSLYWALAPYQNK